MTENEMEELVELLRQARDELGVLAAYVGQPDTICAGLDLKTAAKCQKIVHDRIVAALKKHSKPVEKPKDDPFRPQFQRAYVNGCCVDVVRYEDGAYQFAVCKPHRTRGWVRIGNGAADSEEACKMLAIRAAEEVA
jgi:hypothetical protein